MRRSVVPITLFFLFLSFLIPLIPFLVSGGLSTSSCRILPLFFFLFPSPLPKYDFFFCFPPQSSSFLFFLVLLVLIFQFGYPSVNCSLPSFSFQSRETASFLIGLLPFLCNRFRFDSASSTLFGLSTLPLDDKVQLCRLVAPFWNPSFSFLHRAPAADSTRTLPNTDQHDWRLHIFSITSDILTATLLHRVHRTCMPRS